jgi:hypothetical protein
MYYYIYKVTNPDTGEFYIGRRKCSLDPELDIDYKGSMSNWKVDKSILVKEILIRDIEDMETLEELEIKLITENIKDPLNRNAHIPGKGFVCRGHSEETKKKLSEHFTGRPNPNYPKTLSDEARKNISEGSKGKILSEEHKQKLSIASSNRKLTEEHKKNIGKQWETRIVSEETKKKLSEIAKSRDPMSKETKDKISKSLKGKVLNLSDSEKERRRSPKSEETKAKMRKPKSPEHVAKIKEAKRKKKEEMLKNQQS